MRFTRMCNAALSSICMFASLRRSIGFDLSLTSRSLSNFNFMHYERCLRVKIRDNTDDDGNSYFYNGAFRSQGVMYMAYRLCSDSACSDGGTSYLVPGYEVLNNNVAYTQDFCNSCTRQCYNRRHLEEAQEENGKNYEVNCQTCVSQCSAIIRNYNEGEDETEYLQCQESHMDDSGMQYYSNPACDSSGRLTIGLFYDEECTVKKDDSSEYGNNFALNTFHALQEISMNCADGICDAVEEDGFQCTEGSNFNENVEDDLGVCRAYKKVTKEWQYARPKRDYHTALIVALVASLLAFLFGSYTYYVRHKRAAAEKADQEATPPSEEPTKAEYAEMM